jgi:hypothetical protein
MVFSFLTLGIYGTLLANALALPVQNGLSTRAAANPIIGGQNFPDPGVIKTGQGWYAFSTNAIVNGKRVYMQKAFTSDWKNWQFTPGEDAFPVLPSWVDSGNARVVSVQLNQSRPSILTFDSGRLTLYSSAMALSSCITLLH